MPVSFVNVGTSAKAASGNVTPGLPPGWAADDIHVLVVTSGDNVAVTLPAGWTKWFEVNNTTIQRGTIAWRRAVAGDTAPLVTHAAGDSIVAQIYGLRGCVTAGDPANASGQQTNASSVTVTAPTITPTDPDGLVLAIGQIANTDTSTPESFGVFSGTNPTFTERGDDETGLGVNEVGQCLDTGTTTGAATGSRTSTAVAAGVNIGTLIALSAAAGGAYTRSVAHLPATKGPGRRKLIRALRRPYPIEPSTTAASPQTIDLGGNAIASAEAFGTLKVNFSILPGAIASTESLGAPQVNFRILVTGIASGEVVPTSAKVNLSVLGAGAVPSAEAVATGDKLNFTLSLAGAIASGQTFGNATIVQVGGPQTISGAGGISTSEAVGAPRLLTGLVIGGVGSVMRIIVIEPEARSISVPAIRSAERVGAPRLRLNIGIRGIRSAGALGGDSEVRIRPSARQLADERDLGMGEGESST
jgi:hypothetical protein